jgi:hypothetical protein
MLDRALRATFRNFSTLFLLAALVFVPLHIAYAFAFRRVLAVSELHRAIAQFPGGRLVQGVGREQLSNAHAWSLGLTLLEAVLLPFLVAAADRVLAEDARSGVPTVLGALSLAPARLAAPPRDRAPAAAGGAVVALAVAWLARSVGLLVAEPLPARLAWAGVGLAEGGARALGGAMLIGTLAFLARPQQPAATKDT